MQRSMTTAALLAAALSPQLATAETSEMEALRAQLRAMQSRLDQLETEAVDRSATDRLQAATDAALADAESRVNYQADQMLAGHDGKTFFLESEDGGFSLGLSGQAQVRYIYNERSNAPGDGLGDSDSLSGFQLRRTKLKGKGHIADPKINYNITLATNRDSNDVFLEELAVGYAFDNGVEVSAGRFKAPFAYDELTSSSRQQAVERSLVNELFTVGFTEGLQVEFEPAEPVLVRLMFNDGAGAGEGGNGDFNETPTDYAFTGRVDFTFGGSSGFAKDYTSWAEDESGVNLGLAAHHQHNKTGAGVDADDLDAFTRFTADVLYNAGGLSLFGAAYVQLSDPSDDTAAEVDPFGFHAQAGYTFDDKIEPFVRYEWIDTDVAGADEISLVTVGVNYYLAKHSAKFTLDGVYALDPLNGISVSDGFGLQGDDADEDGQFAIRAQFQLLF